MSSDIDAFGPMFAVFATVVPIIISLFGLAVSIICGVVAMNMAKKRGIQHVPAFFAGFFGSIVALFIIAMFPKQDQ
jgi:hypothetical protein